MAAELRPAVFLDRDGTLIAEQEYLADPTGVRVLPGAPAALGRLRHAGFALVIVTNQSGIARGYYTEAEYAAVQRRVETLFAQQDVHFAGVYHCPHHPDFTGPCDCRKPGLALYLRAAADLSLDLGRSLFVGDRLSDVEPARAFGARAFLVTSGYGAAHAPRAAADICVLPDIGAVASIIERSRA